MKFCKKILTLLLLLLVLVVGGAFAVHAEDGASDTNNRKLVRVGYLIHSGYQEGGPNRPKTGYGYEYLQRVAYEANWNYEYVYGSFRELIGKLEKGEIDLMGNLSYTPERAEQFLYGTKPQGKEKFYIYANLQTNPDIVGVDIASLNGLRVGVSAGTLQETLIRQWIATNGANVRVLTFKNGKECDDALTKGVIDLTVAVGMSNKQVNSQHVEPIIYLGSESFYFGVSKQRPDLLADLNRAQGIILDQNPNYNEEVYNKYRVLNLADKMLSQRELEWLKNHETIKVGYLRDYLPYSSTDDDTGRMVGFLKDFEQNMIRNFMEHNLQFVNVEYTDFPSMLTALKNGEIDTAFPAAGYYWLAEKVSVAVSDPVVTDLMMMIYNDALNVHTTEVIGVEKGSVFQRCYVQIHYPDAKIVEFATIDDCIEAVKDGKVGCMFYDECNYRNDSYKFKGLKANSHYQPVNVSFLTNYKDRGLNSLLNKGISMMGHDRINASLVNASSNEGRFDWKRYAYEHTAEVNWVICFFALVGMGLFGIYHYSNKRHQRVLEVANETLRHQSETIEALAGTYLGLGCVDLHNELYTFYTGNIGAELFEKEQPIPLNLVFERVRSYISIADHRRVLDFIKPEHLKNELKHGNYTFLDYRNRHSNWCRLECIVSKRCGEEVEEVLLGVRHIDEEKAREYELKRIKSQLEKQRVEGMALQYKAEHDGLTDLLNRTAFEDVRSQLLHADEPVGLMLVDIDNFKTINDTYGHEAGDKVLVKLSKLLCNSFRAEDMLFRIGGDEMAVIFLNIDATQCDFIDEKVAGINAKMAISLDGEPAASISAGTYISQHGFPEYMFNGADEALYAVKRNGRGGSKIYVGGNDVMEDEASKEAAAVTVAEKQAEGSAETIATQSNTEAGATATSADAETDKPTK